jgi:5-formyltetrahydrofolate cyclo-ligase
VLIAGKLRHVRQVIGRWGTAPDVGPPDAPSHTGYLSDFSQRPKSAVRAELLSARRSRADLATADARVRAVLARLAAGLGTVAGYVPLPNEPGGPLLPDVLASACRHLLLPVVRPDRDLDWAGYDGSLAPAALGLSEPPGPRLGPAAIAAAELVVVPAVAVDRSGVRLGRGGGSYDRALARVGPGTLLVAALYPGELVDRLPYEPHDIRVAAVATPDGLVRFACGPALGGSFGRL